MYLLTNINWSYICFIHVVVATIEFFTENHSSYNTFFKYIAFVNNQNINWLKVYKDASCKELKASIGSYSSQPVCIFCIKCYSVYTCLAINFLLKTLKFYAILNKNLIFHIMLLLTSYFCAAKLINGVFNSCCQL